MVCLFVLKVNICCLYKRYPYFPNHSAKCYSGIAISCLVTKVWFLFIYSYKMSGFKFRSGEYQFSCLRKDQFRDNMIYQRHVNISAMNSSRISLTFLSLSVDFTRKLSELFQTWIERDSFLNKETLKWKTKT